MTCLPWATLKVSGEEHRVNRAPSSEHSNLEDVVDLNAKVTVALLAWRTIFLGFLGFLVNVVSGSTTAGGTAVKERVVGVSSTLPDASVARAWTTWSPSASAGVTKGVVQAVKVSSATRRSNVPASSEDTPKAGVVSVVVAPK